MTTTYRIATIADLDTLQALSCQTFSATFGAENQPEKIADYLATAYAPAQLTAELENPHSRFVFAEVDNTLAGYLKLNIDDAQTEKRGNDRLEVERIYFLPEWQHHGLGRQFIAYAEQVARADGKHYVWLGVWEHNENAKAFYAKMEFQKVGQHSFVLGDDPQTDFILEKAL